MKIKLSPCRMDEQLAATVDGDILTVNGVALDFSPLQEGETLPHGAINTQWIASDVTRINGELHLTLVLPHGAHAPQKTRFPVAYDQPMTVTKGKVFLPPYDEATA